MQRCKSAYGLCKGAKVKETAIKGGSMGRPDDGLGFIHSVLDAVLYAVIDSALHA